MTCCDWRHIFEFDDCIIELQIFLAMLWIQETSECISPDVVFQKLQQLLSFVMLLLLLFLFWIFVLGIFNSKFLVFELFLRDSPWLVEDPRGEYQSWVIPTDCPSPTILANLPISIILGEEDWVDFFEYQAFSNFGGLRFEEEDRATYSRREWERSDWLNCIIRLEKRSSSFFWPRASRGQKDFQ